MGHPLASTYTNKPTILSTRQPTTTCQGLKTRNELDGLHRRCMPNTLEGQGRCLLSATLTTKQVTCGSLRMGTNLRNTTTNDRTLRVQPRTTHGTKDNQRGPSKEKGTTWANPLDEVLQRRMLATQGGENEKPPLPQKTDTRGKERERMGKGRKDTPLGGGEPKNPAGYRNLPKANPRTAGRAGQRQEKDCRPRNNCRKPEKDDHELGIHARQSGNRGKDPPLSNGEIRGPQKRRQANWAEVVRFGKLALWDQR